MCGLHGIITNKHETNGDDFIRSAFVANTLRGTDSSGIAQIKIKSNTYDYHKLPVAGYHYVGDKVASGLIRNASSADTITMCHVRAATVGSINISNAHPFVYTDEEDGRVVIGTHNGTLTGWSSNPTAKGFTVDSEWAINHIAEEGFDAFEDFYGAYCFVWWDSDKKDTLNIARNTERPMYVAMLETGGMAYASEAGMLYWLLERHNVKMKGKILELQAGYWYKFNNKDPSDFDKVKLPPPYATRYRTGTSSVNTNTNYNSSTSMSKVRDLIARIKASVNKEETDKKESASANVVKFQGKSPKVSVPEYNAAKNLNLVGETAYFTPVMEWADGVEGVARVLNAELSATVRGYDGSHTIDEEWECKILGVVDDTDDMTLILDFPIKKESKVVYH